MLLGANQPELCVCIRLDCRPMFRRGDCITRKAYCGDGRIPNDTATKKYSRRGSNRECLTKGIGMGLAEERRKHIDPNRSLQTIDYIGPLFEENFRSIGIRTTRDLLTIVPHLPNTRRTTRDIVEYACTRKGGSIDQRAVNAVLMFLHDSGIGHIPECRIVRE